MVSSAKHKSPLYVEQRENPSNTTRCTFSHLAHCPQYPPNEHLLPIILIDLNPPSIPLDIRVNRIRNQMPLAPRNPQNQVIEATSPQNIDMVASIRAASRTESVWLVRHFVCYDGDRGGVVAFDFLPGVVAHVARGEEIDGPVAFAHYDAAVDEAVGGCDGRV